MNERVCRFLQFVGTLLLNVILYSASLYIVLKALALIPDRHADLSMYLKIIIATGAFGGMLRSLFSRGESFELTTVDTSSSPRLSAGTFGDILLGIGGSVAVFFVFANSLRLDTSVGSILMVVSLGIIAGFAGRNLLAILQLKIERQVREAEEKAEKAELKAEKAVSLSTAKSYYAIAESLVLAYDARVVPGDRQKFVLDQAAHQLEEGLRVEPGYSKAMVLRGVVKKRLAELTTNSDEKKDLWKQAIDHCRDALREDRNLAVAHFNIACYQSLLWEDPPKAIIANLELAVKLDPKNINELNDPDLANLTKTQEFEAFRERHGIQPP